MSSNHANRRENRFSHSFRSIDGAVRVCDAERERRRAAETPATNTIAQRITDKTRRTNEK